MDVRFFVSVFVPTLGRNGEDQGGKQGRIGTGYPVGEDLILTSRHVVRQDKRDTQYPITIRWWGLQDDDTASSRVDLPTGHDEKNSIFWEGDEDLDAIVLRCPRPAGLEGHYGIISEEKPAAGMSWDGYGFPEAGVFDDSRRAVGCRGNVYPDPDPTKLFEVDVDANPLEDKWGGASGMPVFVNQRILGVVRKRTPFVGGARLLVVPSCELLKDKKFREAIGFDCQKERRRKFRKRLIRQLKSSPLAAETMAECLAWDDQVVPGDSDRTATQLADQLLGDDLNKVIEGLRKAHRNIRDELDDDDSSVEIQRADAALIDIAQLIVPTLYDHGVIEWARRQRDGISSALIALPAGNSTVAEIIMAAVDQRSTRYRARQREGDFPAGEFSLPHVPEGGMDATPGQSVNQVRSHLAEKFGPIDVKKFRQALDGYLALQFLNLDPGRNVKNQVPFIADEIANQTKDRGWHFYMVFQTPSDPAERQQMETLVQGLKADYPAIVFLALPNDDNLLRHDRNRFDPFVRMLPLKRS